MKHRIQAILGVICIFCCMTVCACAQASSIKDENILFDAADVIAYVMDDGTPIRYGDFSDCLILEFIIENHSSRDVFLGIDTVCINDWVCVAGSPGSIPAGKKKKVDFQVDIDVPDIHSLDDIHTMEIEWYLFDDNSYETITGMNYLTISFTSENGQITYKFIRKSDDEVSETTPSVEPEPTDTPEPEATDTPSVEPEPTDTPAPEATDTPSVEPEPTDTPEPEATDTPSVEPEPTDTPEPEATESAPQSTPSAEPESEEWFSSDDGIVKARIDSVDTSAYPQIKIHIQFCLEGEQNDITKPVTWWWTWDLSNRISDFAAKNPSYGNRKIPINVQQINAFPHIRGTVYELYMDYTLGTNDEYSDRLRLTCVDLAAMWPDEYINYDTARAVAYLKEIQKTMFTPSSLEVREAKVYFSETTPNVVFYYFKIAGQVRTGGNTFSEIVARYNSENGEYLIYNFDTQERIAQNYKDRNDVAEMYEILSLFRSNYSICTLNTSDINNKI